MANVEHCNFIGHLENEPEACVAMTGCFGSEDVHFTILSSHATKSPMFKWTKDGNVEIIEMDRMRTLIADHMVMSKHVSPHVTSFVEADVTNLFNWRNKIKKK